MVDPFHFLLFYFTYIYKGRRIVDIKFDFN